MENVINHKRIAKNTFFLYIRQIITMIIALVTTGIVMRELGVEDYGIYNVVGGVVALFSILQGAMAVGTQRFLNYEMGKNNTDSIREVFNISVFIYYAIAIIVVIISETVGLWYLSEKMVIPSERLFAAHWVYQFSIISCVLAITQTPYTAVLIANEKMEIFGILGVMESVSRFVLILLLCILNTDKLILYGVINLLVGIFFRILYRVYCNQKFPECKSRIPRNLKLCKDMVSFSGWNLLAKIAYVGRDQGGIIIVNSFFGVALNASVSVATNVNGVVSSFVNNFQTAYRPQLVKAYALNDIKGVLKLFFMSSKISSFLMLILTIPVIINIDYLLHLWLGIVPEKCGLMIIILMIDSFISALFSPFWMTIFAMGNIKNYQLMEGFIVLLNVPFMFLAFAYDLGIEWMFIIRLFLVVCLFLYAIMYLRKTIQFPIYIYLINIVLPIVFVGIVSLFLTFIAVVSLSGISKIILSTIIYLSLFSPLFYTIALSSKEKSQIKTLLKKMNINI